MTMLMATPTFTLLTQITNNGYGDGHHHLHIATTKAVDNVNRRIHTNTTRTALQAPSSPRPATMLDESWTHHHSYPHAWHCHPNERPQQWDQHDTKHQQKCQNRLNHENNRHSIDGPTTLISPTPRQSSTWAST
mmetsp:Transcript_62673/g.104193  ORF Transcript_62673/g.104193 Transcript_62673/m.104193 type:complete len:134 (-) Transcript_62673:1750-2151(-)